jgi:hypothetical protein
LALALGALAKFGFGVWQYGDSNVMLCCEFCPQTTDSHTINYISI